VVTPRWRLDPYRCVIGAVLYPVVYVDRRDCDSCVVEPQLSCIQKNCRRFFFVLNEQPMQS